MRDGAVEDNVAGVFQEPLLVGVRERGVIVGLRRLGGGGNEITRRGGGGRGNFRGGRFFGHGFVGLVAVERKLGLVVGRRSAFRHLQESEEVLKWSKEAWKPPMESEK